MRLALPLAFLLTAVVLPSFAAEAPTDADPGPFKLSPVQVGQIFCIAGVGNDMAPVEAIITPSLKQAIAKADALEAAWEKKNPGEKPPLGDGLPWRSSADYTTTCVAEGPTETAAEARVNISYKFADDPAANYTDVLILKPVKNPEMADNIWRIDDVAFADKTSMRSVMVDAFKP